MIRSTCPSSRFGFWKQAQECSTRDSGHAPIVGLTPPSEDTKGMIVALFRTVSAGRIVPCQLRTERLSTELHRSGLTRYLGAPWKRNH